MKKRVIKTRKKLLPKLQKNSRRVGRITNESLVIIKEKLVLHIYLLNYVIYGKYDFRVLKKILLYSKKMRDVDIVKNRSRHTNRIDSTKRWKSHKTYSRVSIYCKFFLVSRKRKKHFWPWQIPNYGVLIYRRKKVLLPFGNLPVWRHISSANL